MAILRDVIISMVIVGMVVTGLFTWHQGLADNYNVTIDSNYQSVYNDLNSSIGSSYSLSKDIEGKVGQTESISAFEGVALLSKVALEAIKLPLNALNFAVTYITRIGSILGVPGWLIVGLITLVITGVAFLVLSAYLRRDI